MSELKKGYVVVLKSGGPDMTIVELGDYSPMHSEDGAKCQWFEGKKLQEGIFDVSALRPSGGSPRPVVI